MPTVNKYHPEKMVTITVGGKEVTIPLSKAAKKLREIQLDGVSAVTASDRMYIKTEDGSYRKLEPSLTKAERKAKKRMYRELLMGKESK